MFKRTFQLLRVACLATGTLRAANDPFVGDWKLNPSRSKLTDQMKDQSIAASKYAFDFGDGSGVRTVCFTATFPSSRTYSTLFRNSSLLAQHDQRIN